MKIVPKLVLAGVLCGVACGYAQRAAAASPLPENSQASQNDFGMVVALQQQVARLQAQVQKLQASQGQTDGQTRYIFDAVSPPNPDNAPIPSGG